MFYMFVYMCLVIKCPSANNITHYMLKQLPYIIIHTIYYTKNNVRFRFCPHDKRKICRLGYLLRFSLYKRRWSTLISYKQTKTVSHL